MDALNLIIWIILGTVLGSVLSLIPSLHIYNVAGVILILNIALEKFIPLDVLAYFMLAMVVAYSIVNTVPSIFLNAPDDSLAFTILPGQQYMLMGKGFEAAMLTNIGCLAGIIALILMTPAVFTIFPKFRIIIREHMAWILGSVIAFMLITEWPKGTDRAPTGLGRFMEAWASLFAGLLTFVLAGLLGIIIMNKTIVPVERAFQSIMPVFVGIFALPGLMQNILARIKIPKQHIATSVDLDFPLFLRGGAAGFLGGIFAAYFPIITGGIGGLMAGHATAQRDERLFVVSQGASRLVYYTGSFLLAFAPGLMLTRGGMAWIMAPFFTARVKGDYYLALAAVALAGGLSFLLTIYLAKWLLKILPRINFTALSIAVMIFLTILVYWLTSWTGIILMIVATGIGSIPVFFYSRRMNCMAVLLVPITINMAGLGPLVNRLLGLV